LKGDNPEAIKYGEGKPNHKKRKHLEVEGDAEGGGGGKQYRKRRKPRKG